MHQVASQRKAIANCTSHRDPQRRPQEQRDADGLTDPADRHGVADPVVGTGDDQSRGGVEGNRSSRASRHGEGAADTEGTGGPERDEAEEPDDRHPRECLGEMSTMGGPARQPIELPEFLRATTPCSSSATKGDRHHGAVPDPTGRDAGRAAPRDETLHATSDTSSDVPEPLPRNKKHWTAGSHSSRVRP